MSHMRLALAGFLSTALGALFVFLVAHLCGISGTACMLVVGGGAAMGSVLGWLLIKPPLTQKYAT
ncbi:hypothetical protein JCM17844_00590 [Iodidimonas gelatinilytica]|uniref:Uncharacterized protein n=1 Tax=Iodidimonas gelatinilytica TaxID=1236966 RepID=A0A5A7MK81_9PROT|nr:hypothetical protein [Iodidimonas gelatinilytica]GEQ96422.1 hypothetical protein JCM17844_00590 [Iodidimonas gelatinilytica]GER00248.1 hypothetical protein JCM17845_08710 [Iodidimonas gelatinilytica]